MMLNNEKEELKNILKERYISNRNLNHVETVDECIETMFFGFGTFEKLKKAHINNYKKYTLSNFFATLLDGNNYIYYLSNIDNCIFTKDKYINFSHKELKFILLEFDFEINSIYFKSDEDGQIEVYIELSNSNDTEEILNLQKKRLNKIEQTNKEIERLLSLKNSL